MNQQRMENLTNACDQLAEALGRTIRRMREKTDELAHMAAAAIEEDPNRNDWESFDGDLKEIDEYLQNLRHSWQKLEGTLRDEFDHLITSAKGVAQLERDRADAGPASAIDPSNKLSLADAAKMRAEQTARLKESIRDAGSSVPGLLEHLRTFIDEALEARSHIARKAIDRAAAEAFEGGDRC